MSGLQKNQRFPSLKGGASSPAAIRRRRDEGEKRNIRHTSARLMRASGTGSTGVES
jgi:hypothetical protein